jgi:hypothetical protein
MVAGLCAGMMLSAEGCQKKKKKAPPPPPPPPPAAPPPPEPVDVKGLMQSLKPDARVQFVDSQAPADASLAEATIKLASALAKGDKAALSGLLTPEARNILDTLAADGTFGEETKKIEQVRVVRVSPLDEAEVSSATVVLAVQAPDGAYPLAWRGSKSGTEWKFAGMPSDGAEKRRASDFDSGGVSVGAAPAEPEPAAPTESGDEGGGANPSQPSGAPGGGETPKSPGKSVPGGRIPIPGGGG